MMENKYIGKFEMKVYEGKFPGYTSEEPSVYLGVDYDEWPTYEMPWGPKDEPEECRKAIRAHALNEVLEMEKVSCTTLRTQDAIQRVLKDASIDDLIKLREAKLI
jgi:hypothetical protein